MGFRVLGYEACGLVPGRSGVGYGVVRVLGFRFQALGFMQGLHSRVQSFVLEGFTESGFESFVASGFEVLGSR